MKKTNSETQLAYCRCSWVAFIVPGLLSLLCFTGLTTGDDVALPMFLCGLVIAVIFIVIPYKTTYLKLTDKRLIGHRGFIFSTRMSVTVDKIQDIQIENGLFGKIFKYHTVIVYTSTPGTPKYVFRKMTNAVLLCDTIQGVQD